VGLAAATAAATAATSQPSSASRSTPGHGIGSLENAAVDPPPISNTGVSSTPSYGTGALSSDRPSSNRSESWRHVPGQFPSPTPDDSKTFLFYRDALVPVPGAETPLAPGHHAMHDQYPLTGSTPGSSQTTSGPHSSGLANKADPRVDSDRDGSRITAASSGLSGDTAGSTNTSSTTPHNSNLLNKLDPRIDSDRDGSKTLGGTSSGRHEPGQTAGASTVAPTTQHELRHTGSLEQPKPRSSDDDHHHGREAAVAGGVGVGAAGLGTPLPTTGKLAMLAVMTLILGRVHTAPKASTREFWEANPTSMSRNTIPIRRPTRELLLEFRLTVQHPSF
jgi:hypothetical protein